MKQKQSQKQKGLKMANKISIMAASAFYNNQKFSLSNTYVNNNQMFLHGNKILWKDESGAICFSLCGWDTLTTCARLRAAGIAINHKKGKLFYNDIAISDCESYRINDDNTITKL